jgi:hypothetical protein
MMKNVCSKQSDVPCEAEQYTLKIKSARRNNNVSKQYKIFR